MSRLAHLFTALTLTCAMAAAIVAACGAPPLMPREAPPLAPRPERLDPTVVPVPTATDPGESPSDAGPVTPGASAAFSPAAWQLAAAQPFQRAPDASPADAGGGAADAPRPVPPPTTPSPPPPADASPDAYAQPLPPIPDGNLPADSRLEPIRLRD